MNADKYRLESFTGFMAKKAVRIFPMAWITITVHALTLTAYRFMTGKDLAPIGIWKYIKSMALIFDAGIIRTTENGFNNPLWYLGVLIICYAVFWSINQESVHKTLGSVPVWIFFVLLGLGVTSYEMDVPFLNHNTARGVVPFFFGCVLFCLYKKIKKEKCRRRFACLFVSSMRVFGYCKQFVFKKADYKRLLNCSLSWYF